MRGSSAGYRAPPYYWLRTSGSWLTSMLSRLRSILGRFDWVLLGAVLMLLVMGMAAIWTVALSRDASNLETVNKQLIAAMIGFVLLFFCATAHYRLFKNYSFLIGVLTLVLLVVVLFAGRTIRGTTGWFSVAGWNFQPVELAKFSLVLFLAKYFDDHPRAAFRMRQFLISSAVVGVTLTLVFAQPDFGSALILVAVWLGMLAFARVRIRYLLIVIGGAIAAVFVAWFFLFAPYQKDRVLTFLDPGRDPLGRGYNVKQAIIAVGSGELFGRGLGFGSQTQLRFLPESQTDFIFAVLAEQLGFVGVLLILIFYGIILWRLLGVAKSASDDFSAFLALGILLIFTIQFVVNVGMNVGLMPVTGIALPFVSYGGSALLMSLVMLGVVESIAVRRPYRER